METSKHGKNGAAFVQKVAMSPTDWLVDCVIALGAFGFGLIQLTLSANLFVPDAFTRMLLGIRAATPSPAEVAATLLTCLPLVVRRKLPWPAYAASLAVWVASRLFIGADSLPLIGPLVALFTVAYERGRGEAIVAGTVVLAVMFLEQAVFSSSNLGALLLFQNSAVAVAVTLGGYALHARQDYVQAAEARAAEAERTRESEASRRVEEERVRIAREIHDITAHSLSAVSIQAAAAERLVDPDPAAAKEAIAEVRRISKSSLEDMRAMVGVLRGGGAAPETTPVEGTERIGDLVNYLEGAGISCDLSTDRYDRGIVPSHIDVALFGIAREACTNIVRHSEAKHATIALATYQNRAYLTVTDDGKGFNERASREGHGIDGMVERARLLGGMMTIMSMTVPGTIVEAEIPLKPASDGFASEGAPAGDIPAS